MSERSSDIDRARREECLEALYRLELAHEPRTVEALAANGDLAEIDIGAVLLDLVARGQVRVEGASIRLERAGRAIGKRIFNRHELAEWTMRHLGLRKEAAHDEACRIEHEMGERADADLLELMGKGAIPLSLAREGASYRVRLISGGGSVRRRLVDLGMAPGGVVLLEARRNGGPIQVQVQGSSLALGRGIAAKVVVTPVPGDAVK